MDENRGTKSLTLLISQLFRQAFIKNKTKYFRLRLTDGISLRELTVTTYNPEMTG